MIIPAIDLINGQVVRLYQGDYGQKTAYSDNPQARFDDYVSQGAAQLHLVDLDGAKDAKARQLALIAQLLSATEAPVQVGGGVRSEQDVADLLAAGASRVVIGSTAVKSPDLVASWMEKYGPERIVLAGFSQGGVIASFTALRHPVPLAGLLCMSTYLAVPDALPDEMSEAARALPICYMHGIYDDVVNLSMGWDAKNRLEAAGLSPEWHESPMRHEICRPQLGDIRSWLLARLGA